MVNTRSKRKAEEDLYATRAIEMSTFIFPLKSLPKEIRALIYPLNNALALPHRDNALPHLLTALAADPELLAEALPIYQRVNIRITKKNEEDFKAMRMKQLLKFRNIKLVWDGPREEEIEDTNYRPLGLRAHKVLLINNFESITLVLEEGRHAWGRTRELTRSLIGASRPGVTRLVVRVFGKTDYERWELNRTLGVKGHLEYGGVPNSGEQVWIWERPDCKKLVWENSKL